MERSPWGALRSTAATLLALAAVGCDLILAYEVSGPADAGVSRTDAGRHEASMDAEPPPPDASPPPDVSSPPVAFGYTLQTVTGLGGDAHAVWGRLDGAGNPVLTIAGDSHLHRCIRKAPTAWTCTPISTYTAGGPWSAVHGTDKHTVAAATDGHLVRAIALTPFFDKVGPKPRRPQSEFRAGWCGSGTGRCYFVGRDTSTGMGRMEHLTAIAGTTLGTNGKPLNGVWFDGKKIYVVGEQCELYHSALGANGLPQNLKKVPLKSCSGTALNTVWAAGGSVFVGGDGGLLLRRDVTGSWHKVAVSSRMGATDIVAVQGSSADNVLMVGRSGEVSLLVEGTPHSTMTVWAAGLGGLWVSDATTAWVVGNKATIVEVTRTVP